MRLATTKQCQHMDQSAQERFGLSAEVLMESAGSLAAREIDRFFKFHSVFNNRKSAKLVVICGPGHNGADGLVVARHLFSLGYKQIKIFYKKSLSSSHLYDQQLKRLHLQAIPVFEILDQTELKQEIFDADLIVDAIFGVGFCRSLESDTFQLVEWINASQGFRISLDGPTGLNQDTGRLLPIAVRANLTLVFHRARPGFFIAEGPAHVGKVKIISIGFSSEEIDFFEEQYFLLTKNKIKKLIPHRKQLSHKGNYGHLLVVAGSEGMYGAAVLAATSAFRMGVGYVSWLTEKRTFSSLESLPEMMVIDPDTFNLQQKKYTAILFGPGLGRSKWAGELLKKLRLEYNGPLVLDADGLNLAAELRLFPLPPNWVLTPHAGELSRILGCSVEEIESDRINAAFNGARLTKAVMLLKGYRSILVSDQKCFVNTCGNAALAKAGTGDVLAGMIGSLLAQGIVSINATCLAIYLHGLMADEWVASGKSPNSLSASDIQEHLPQMLSRLSLEVDF